MGKPIIGVTLPAFRHAFKKTNGDVWCSLCGELGDDPIHWTIESDAFEPSYEPGAHPYAHHYIPRINSEGDAEYCSVCGCDADDPLHPVAPTAIFSFPNHAIGVEQPTGRKFKEKL